MLLLEADDRIVGFTTASVSDFPFGGLTAKVIFSGDTIVDQPFWDEQQLACAWLGETGHPRNPSGCD